MKRLKVLGAFALLNFSCPPALDAKPKHTPPAINQTIVIYEGLVDGKSAERFTNLISANTDKIIGLKIAVEKSTDADKRYYSDVSEDQLNVTSGDPTDAPVEVLINGGLGTTMAGAFYTADGFYLIKSGGSHAAGAVSFGAEPVSEASIRLNARIRLVRRRF